MKRYFAFIVIVLLIFVFSSCQNNTTAPKNTFLTSELTGVWTATGASFPIQYFNLMSSGSIYMYDGLGGSDYTYIQNWSSNYEVEVFEITIFFTTGNLYLTFNNPNSCTARYNSQIMTFIKN